jgi:hypothetical protein
MGLECFHNVIFINGSKALCILSVIEKKHKKGGIHGH